MSRRRRGLFGRILGGLEEFFREGLSWFLWPFYVVRDALGSLLGGGSDLRRRSWGQVFLDSVLLIPMWVGSLLMWLYHSILRWPRIMRLRDLASGLPALLAAIAAVVIVFGLKKEEEDLVASYGNRTLDLHNAAQAETDETARANTLKLAQFYARALLKLKPDDLMNRYHVGYFYQEMGEHARAQAIIDSLAPRDREGFAPAHVWQGDHILSGPLTPEALADAEAHFLWALGTHKHPEEIHRRLGDLYYLRYRRYNPRTIDPRMPSQAMYLALADDHFSKVATLDSRALLTLAEIRLLRGKREQAEVDVKRVIDDLQFRLDGAPADKETALLLAQAYRMARKFENAANVLIAAMNLSPDPRCNEALCMVYYYWSRDIRQQYPRAFAAQFAQLHKAYLTSPTNGYVVYRYAQALTSEPAEEAQFARESLQAAVDAKTPGRTAAFLLGFDYRRRSVPQRAGEYFRLAKSGPPDGTPGVIAGLVNAVYHDHVKSLDVTVANQLFADALEVWPNDPDLLIVNGEKLLRLGQYPTALIDLKKALEQRPRDARLHEFLAATYQQQGLLDLAKQHREKADAYRVNVTPLGL